MPSSPPKTGGPTVCDKRSFTWTVHEGGRLKSGSHRRRSLAGDNQTVMQLEFWPDYGPGPLWEQGKPADLRSLGLPRELAKQLTSWNSQYEENKLPLDGLGDDGWVAEGAYLLRKVRLALGAGYNVVVTEPWWGEVPV